MKRFSLFLLANSILLGCSKDDIVVCSTAAALTGLHTVAPTTQSFTFNLSQAQSLHTSGGATLAFGANALLLPDERVATGQATLRMREIYTVSDMVLADMPTTTVNNQLLVSAGELNIQVWQGNNRLHWSRGVSIANTAAAPQLSVPIPQAGLDTTKMRLWNLAAVADSASLVRQLGWQPVWFPNPAGVFSQPVITNTGGLYTAALPLDSISWINFDQFWRYENQSAWSWAKVRVPSGASETRVYLRPAGYTSLSRGLGTGDPTLWQNHFPDGTDVQAIVIQIRDDQYYFGTQHYTWQANVEMSPALQALSAAEVVARIRQL